MTPTPREPRFLFFSMCVSQIQDFGYETALERILELLAGGIHDLAAFSLNGKASKCCNCEKDHHDVYYYILNIIPVLLRPGPRANPSES